jgi:hypothetical protein
MFISFSMVSFSSIKIKISFWFYSPIFYQNITYPKGEIRNKYLEINQNIYKQLKIKIKIKICNVLKKYIMQLCKWNAMCKNEMQCV